MKTINPLKRNMSADRQIEEQLELDVINSDISLIEAQIANILMMKGRKHK